MTGGQPGQPGAMIGRVVGGRYTLRSVIGEGGMATIYRGWDAQLEREVAVKLLRPQYGSDPEFVARFRQEARSAGSLSHPNIVGVHDYGSEDGAQFIVMELVEGRDLAAVLRQHAPLAVGDAVEIAIQAAAGLEAAHRRGIVHRDVKPANILLAHDGHVRVVDFGIARAVADAGLTTTGTTLGSVHYFSPEQARGEEVTAASDVYALAIVLYEMLTGRRPFEGDSAAAIALKRLSHDPPSPSEYDRTLPAGLVAIVMRALQREQRARYPSAGVLRHALDDWRATQGSSARSASAALPALSGAPPEPAAAATRGSVAGAAVAAPTVLHPPEGLAVQAATADAARGGPSAGKVVRERGDRRSAWPWAALAVLALALLSGIGFLSVQLLARSGDGTPTTTPGGEVAGDSSVRVPVLTGLTEEAARDALANLGLVAGRVTTRHAEEAEGIVLATSPTADETVPLGSEVALTVSRGPRPTASPTPSPSPTPTADTAAETSPPAPAPVVTAAPPPPPDPTPEPEPPTAPAMDPGETVATWYALVADQQFDAAYALWSDRMRANYPRADNLDGRWDDTDEVVIHALSITYADQGAGVANVYIDFTEIKAGGAQYRLVGSWDLVLGPDGWLLDQPYF